MHPTEVSREFIAATGIYSFAPGHRDRARPLQGRAAPDARARHGDRRPAPDPDGAARRHRADRGAVRRPHRARLREGQHLDRAQDRLRRRAPRVPRREPRQARPAVAPQARPRGGEGRWPSATSACSARPARRRRSTPRPPDRVPALIFDCDGVLADTERDGHRPAFNQAFAEAGLHVAWSEEEYGERLKIGGGKERIASLFDDPRGRARADRSRCTSARPRSTRRSSAPAGCPAARASRASSTRRSPRAGRSRSPPRPPRSPSARCSSTSSAPRPPRASPSSPATSCPPRSPTRASTCSRSSELGVDPRRRARRRGLAQRPARRRRRRPALRRDPEQLHRRGGHARGACSSSRASATRASPRAWSPTAAPRDPATRSRSPTSRPA